MLLKDVANKLLFCRKLTLFTSGTHKEDLAAV
jgi:hypothetical protein